VTSPLDAVLLPLWGGALIGLAAALLLYWNGRIAGISGIVGGLLRARRGEIAWRGAFIGGLLAGGLVLAHAYPTALNTDFRRHAFACVADGLLLRGGPWQASPRAAHHGESYDE
jgi:hypothetical protein